MSKWHPIMELREPTPGSWVMLDSLNHEIGRIELRKVNNGLEARYKVTFRDEVIGWAGSLKYAAERLYAEYIRSLGPAGGPHAW